MCPLVGHSLEKPDNTPKRKVMLQREKHYHYYPYFFTHFRKPPFWDSCYRYTPVRSPVKKGLGNKVIRDRAIVIHAVDHLPALNDPYQHNDCKNRSNVNKPTHGVTAHHRASQN
jgi:hypothetical protein